MRINIAPVGQRFRPLGLQQSSLFQCAKIFAVNPQQVDRTTGLSPGGGFRLDALHGISGIGETHDFKIDRIVGFHLATDPVKILVNGAVTAPGVEPDSLASGLILDLLPALFGVSRSGQQQTRE